MVTFEILSLVVCLGLASAYPGLRDRIPNGRNVTDPCDPTGYWQGVGHLAKQGGGATNQFGQDFRDNNLNWEAVCRMDSDGDGVSNGEELGDPDCIWTQGAVPSRTTGITHPGYCQPGDSSVCVARNAQSGITCEEAVFDCPSIDEPGVENRLLQFPRTEIPNTETNYFCMTFDLDTSRDYHLIANKAEIDNAEVMHHILLYGCQDGAEAIPEPTSCGMATQSCQDVVGLWTVGMTGECMYREAGFRIGQTGYSRLLLEFHWNNPDKKSLMTDATGMRIYFTQNLRQYDAGVFWTGQTYLEIPPNSDRHIEESTCPSDCTKRWFKDTIYFTQGLNHMHYKGIAQSVEKISEDGSSTYLTNEEDYSYDSPKVHIYDPPLPVYPGDSFKTTCMFQSRGETKTIMFGEGTSDEMCFGFFTYFPKSAVEDDICVSYKTYDTCRRQGDYYDDCPFTDFFNNTHPDTAAMVEKVMESCKPYGGCLQECPAAIAEAEMHPCLRGRNREWALSFKADSQDVTSIKFAHAMMSCDQTSEPILWPSSGASVVIQPLTFIFVTALFGRLLM